MKGKASARTPPLSTSVAFTAGGLPRILPQQPSGLSPWRPA